MTIVEEKMSYVDMMKNVNVEMREEIVNTLMSITPIEAICTLSACLSLISFMASDCDKEMAILNIGEIASFAKAVTKNMNVGTEETRH